MSGSLSVSINEFCLFVLGFNVSLSLFQSYCDGTCMRQVRVLHNWNTPVAGTWQEHPNQSHYKLIPGRLVIFRNTHLSMPSVSKTASCTIILQLLVCRGLGSNPQPSVPHANNLSLNHMGLSINELTYVINVYVSFGNLCEVITNDVVFVRLHVALVDE